MATSADPGVAATAKRLANKVLPRSVADAARTRLPESVKGRLRTKVAGNPAVESCPLPRAWLNRDDKGRIPDFCYPLEDPHWVRPDAALLQRDDDIVIGFVTDGPSGAQAWAIPWWVMKNHHVANLELHGRAYLVTLCEACAGGGVYDPVVDGERLRFRVEGVYGGTPFIIDDRTGSLWRMITTEPLHGPALGRGPLPWSPYVHERWDDWRSRYPDTWVVAGEGEPRDGHGSEHLSPGHDDVEAFFFPDQPDIPEDDRLPRTSLVAGVEVGAARVAYPLDEVHAAGGLVADEVGGRPVLVVAKPGTTFAIAFDRRVGDRVLDLTWASGGDPTGPGARLVDAETATTWDLWGDAVDGPLAGEHLAAVPGGVHKWFGWIRTGDPGEVRHP